MPLDKHGLHGIKYGLRKIVNKMGVEIFTLKKIPFGINHLSDVMSMGKLCDPRIIFDVGANIGQTSIDLRRVFKKTDIYAFEPIQSTYRVLAKNLIGTNVKAVNIGFGQREEKRKVFLQNLSELNSLVDSLNKPADSGTSEDVEISTIDNFCARNSIDCISFLKIDTEGFGLKVLSGAENLLKRAAIESIFIEVGFSERDKRHDNFCEVNKMLNKYSFRLLGFYDQWIENARLEYCNALFVLEK